MEKKIFLDYASTTPVNNSVANSMFECLTEKDFVGNPSSDTHYHGWKALNLIERSRKKVADLIAASPKEIIFTSGATESNNLAIRGIIDFHLPEKKHIITSCLEHKSVLETCRFLKDKGTEVTFLSTNKEGEINIKDVEKAIRENTALISIMSVNNELGTYYPIHEIGKIAKKKSIIFHVDGSQSVGKIDINIKKTNIDLLSISAHKMYGPKGIGALFIKKESNIRMNKILYGGAHEQNMRPGTLPTHQIVGFGKACEIAKIDMKKNHLHIMNISSRFRNILSKVKLAKINSSLERSYPGIINVSFLGIDGEALLAFLYDISVSMGSSCDSKVIQSSHVLSNIGLSDQEASSTFRFSFGFQTTTEEIEYVGKKLINSIQNLEMLKYGI